MNKWNINASNLTKKQKAEIDQELILKSFDITELKTGAKLYLLRNDLNEIPKCKSCQKLLNFHTPSCSYRTYCSAKCSANSCQTVDKRRETNIEKYGTKNVLSLGVAERNAKQFEEFYKDFKRFDTKVIPAFNSSDFRGGYTKNEYDWQCVRCNTPFKRLFLPHLHKWPKCPKCDSIFTDIENKIMDFLKKTNFQVRCHYRKIIKHHEVDFFIPELQLAIETNGLYYHTEQFFPDKNYHNNKTNLCLEKDVRLIQVFSDELNINTKACFGRIKAILGLNKKIHGRKCTVREITTELSTKFLNKYHTQESDKSSVKCGLFYKNRLVSVMTFCKPRKIFNQKSEENCWELSRYASMYGFSVQGGFLKLLSHFIQQYKPKVITSYCDKRWTPDPIKSVYTASGFQYIHTSQPNYWYVGKSPKRFHRANFQKHMLLKKHPEIDSNLSESQIMKQLGYQKIWDCGHHKFRMVLN